MIRFGSNTRGTCIVSKAIEEGYPIEKYIYDRLTGKLLGVLKGYTMKGVMGEIYRRYGETLEGVEVSNTEELLKGVFRMKKEISREALVGMFKDFKGYSSYIGITSKGRHGTFLVGNNLYSRFKRNTGKVINGRVWGRYLGSSGTIVEHCGSYYMQVYSVDTLQVSCYSLKNLESVRIGKVEYLLK